MARLPSRPLLLVALAVASGCSPVKPPSAKSLLTPASMAPESSALEVFFVRCPMGDRRANDMLWEQVDEQCLPAEVRIQLTRNGFRAGLIGGQIPDGLSKLLDLAKSPTEGSADRLQGAELQEEPQVIRRHLQVRPGVRQEIITSEVYDELPVLVSDAGQLAGQTYQQAQGMLALKTANVLDGRVRLELLPEIHYGQQRQRWVAGQGMYRLEAGRERRVFDSLAVSTSLARGQMFVMTCLANRPGSIGYHFFCDKRGGRCDQKLLVVRLVQTQHDDLLQPTETMP